MKTITEITSITLNEAGTEITIVGTVADTTFTMPAQQVSVADRPEGNPAWTRAMRITSEAFQCVRYGANSVALAISAWAKLCYTLEPTLSWPVTISTQPETPASIAPLASVTLTVLIAPNELASTYEWQRSAAASDIWTAPETITDGGIYDIGTPASAGSTLTITPTDASLDGYYFRCKIMNSQGDDLYTDSVKLTVT